MRAIAYLITSSSDGPGRTNLHPKRILNSCGHSSSANEALACAQLPRKLRMSSMTSSLAAMCSTAVAGRSLKLALLCDRLLQRFSERSCIARMLSAPRLVESRTGDLGPGTGCHPLALIRPGGISFHLSILPLTWAIVDAATTQHKSNKDGVSFV